MILSSVQKIIRNMVASCVEMDNNQQQQQLTYLQVNTGEAILSDKRTNILLGLAVTALI